MPPLLQLPMEIKQKIFSYLEGPEPTLIILRRTHSHFRNVIPKINLKATLSETDHRDHLVAAENHSKGDSRLSLFPPDHLACFTCLHVLPITEFSDRNSVRKRRFGGDELRMRFCIACGLKEGKYMIGQIFKANDTLCQVAWCAEANRSNLPRVPCKGTDDGGKFSVVQWGKCLCCFTEYAGLHSCEERRRDLRWRATYTEFLLRPVHTGLMKYYAKLVQPGMLFTADIRSKEGVQFWNDGQQFIGDQFV